MGSTKLTKYLLIFLGLWSVWCIWDATEPVINISQLGTLFILLPVSALMVAISFLDEDKDDDGFGGGLREPVVIKAKF